MKKILFILLLIYACKQKESTNTITRSVRDIFITDSILSGSKDVYLLFVIYPSFCGSCTNEVMTFIQGFESKKQNVKYIIPSQSKDYFQSDQLNEKNVISRYDLATLQQHGFTGNINRMFIVCNATIIYESKMINETVDQIMLDLDQLFKPIKG